MVVHDRMQKGYTYFLTEPAGKNFAPEFTPELTPKQMLRLGVFGGKSERERRKIARDRAAAELAEVS